MVVAVNNLLQCWLWIGGFLVEFFEVSGQLSCLGLPARDESSCWWCFALDYSLVIVV
jgi:hypothetical protein